MAATTPTSQVALPGSLLCITCHQVFEDAAAQREHYRSDVHRFNLKRKVAGLAPVSAETYNAKQDALKAAETAKKADENLVFQCTTCNKKFHSDAQLQQHFTTKKHKLQEAEGPVKKPSASSEADSGSESLASSTSSRVPVPTLTEEQAASMTDDELYEWRLKNFRKFGPQDCLFCKAQHESLEENVRHMQEVHSFFIPDIDYLVNLEGLISYLGEKVSIGWTCLYCNGKGRSFQSPGAVQDHMREMSHCKLAYDTDEDEDEIAEFYDFAPYFAAKGIDPETGAEELNQNEHGELILGGSKVAGHRDLRVFYKKQNSGHRNQDRMLIQSLVSEYRALARKKELKDKLPPPRELRRARNYNLRLGENANKIVRLRLRIDNPIL